MKVNPSLLCSTRAVPAMEARLYPESLEREKAEARRALAPRLLDALGGGGFVVIEDFEAYDVSRNSYIVGIKAHVTSCSPS